ncbi:MAG: slipin family protein [Thermomicrobiales bacterium]
MEAAGVVLLVVALFVIFVLLSAIKIVQEYERGVVFRLGRLVGPRGPGLIILIPFVERMVKVDLRTVTMDIPAQEVITRDNVTVRVNAVAYFRVVDSNAAVVNVADFIRATSQIAQTTLRSILGQSVLDELLSEREKINLDLQRIIDEQTEPWGVKVSVVEVKDVELPQAMQRAMARQAEAEREKRAKIIHAEGEFQASQQLAAAAEVIDRNPVALQLRYLQTLTEIGVEKNTTVVFPLPIDLFDAFRRALGAGGVSSPRPERKRPAPAPVVREPAASD